MKKFYALLNILLIIIVIAANTYASVNGINGNTVGGISDKYNTLFAPAGYAFSIWGFIYIGLIVFGIYQFKKVFIDKKEDDFVIAIGPWLSLANLANSIWLYVWLNEMLGLSILLMLVILISLLIIVIKLNMERWDAPFPVIAFIWWPICIYSGWIAVATIANVSAYLVKIEWSWLLSDVTWTIVMIIIATFVNLFMIQSRNMREFAAVGVWAILAIAIRHWGSQDSIAWIAFLSVIILVLAIGYHGYKNRATGPHIKFKEFYRSS